MDVLIFNITYTFCERQKKAVLSSIRVEALWVLSGVSMDSWELMRM